MATWLYAGHCVSLNRFYSVMPLFDSIYSFGKSCCLSDILQSPSVAPLAGKAYLRLIVTKSKGGDHEHNRFEALPGG
ncbi:MAG: hypothetical protein ACI3ZQ_00040, partial [Candidatus Cryptobacteroides sp.]